MKATKEGNSIRSKSANLAPNNSQYDRKNSISDGWYKDATEYANTNSVNEIFNQYGTRRTYGGKYVNRDEPPEDIQYKQADLIRNRMLQVKAAAGRERLKAANKVPTKSGGKLFEDFMKEAYKSRTTKSAIVDLQNIYNAASVLPYEKWLILVADEFRNSRYKKGQLP